MSWEEEHATLIVLVGLSILAVCLATCLLCTIAHAQEPVGCPQVCPVCNVKAEWTGEGYEYEYTDETAIITGTERIVCWQANGTYEITSVCLKAGQDLFWPESSLGCWTTPWHDISHVVICTTKPTAIGLVNFHAPGVPDLGLALFLIAVAAMGFGLYVIVKAGRGHE